jgi:hypothetical protein
MTATLCVFAAAGCMEEGMDEMGEMDDGPVAEGVSGKLGDPIPTATPEQLATFERGREVALKRFDLADGLGPAFNVTFCAACHERPEIGGGAALYRNFFLSGSRTQDGAFVFGQSAGMAGGVIRVFSYAPGLPARPVIPAETTVFAQRNAIAMFGASAAGQTSTAASWGASDESLRPFPSRGLFAGPFSITWALPPFRYPTSSAASFRWIVP